MVLTEFDENKYAAMLREEGKIQGLCELVSDGELSLKAALRRTGMTEQEFKEAMMGFGLKWNKEKFRS